MSLFGKILAFLNILAVVGALALLSMNYSRIRSWQYAVYKVQLTIDGLPVDRDSRDEQGEPLYLRVNSDIQRELFPQGSPVATQQEEVERVRQQVQTLVQAVPDKEGQIAQYSRILLPMAVTESERDRLLTYMVNLYDDKSRQELKEKRLHPADTAARNPAKPAEPGARVKRFDEHFRDAILVQAGPTIDPFVDAYLQAVQANPAQGFDQAYAASIDAQHTELAGWLDGLFNAALTLPPGATVPAGQKPLRKQVIARLLFNLIDAVPQQGQAQGQGQGGDLLAQPGYRRFFAVVGADMAAQTINDQAQALRAIVPQVGLERVRDRSRFADAQNRLIDVIQTRAWQLEQNTAELQRRQKELTGQNEALNKRKLNVKEMTDELEASRQATAREMATLRELSKQLYDLRVKLRDATDKSQNLEKEIRELEADR
jgi:hypothetical protein